MSYLAEKLLDHVFNAIAYPPPESLWLALTTDFGEVVGGGYARTNVTGQFSRAENDIVSNNQVIQTPKPTVGWGTITGGKICDAETGGNDLFIINLQTPFNAIPNTDIIINPGILIFGVSSRT